MEKVLLHCCCAPCSSAIIEWMQNNLIQPVIFYFNPNIYPLDEYLKRKNECIRYANAKNVEFIDGDYNHAEWLEKIKGYETCRERGDRCLQCFKTRLQATAHLAEQMNIPLFTTTLSASRWKSYEQIVEAGAFAESMVENTRFWNKNWKKGGLSERRRILLLENEFYNQDYCGCEFSFNTRNVQRK